MSRIIAVIGATGQQGSSIANVLLQTNRWNVRAITRNPASDTAKELANKGAQVVAADLNDEQSLVKAFEGAHAVFGLTNFWEHLFSGKTQAQSGEIELAQGMNIARAAAQTSTLEHYIWSTTGPASEMTGGRFPSPHWDYKARVDGLIRAELPELAAKTTFLLVGYYPSNLAFYPMLRCTPLPGPDSKYVWIQPCSPRTRLMVAGDMHVNPGVYVRQILANPEKTKTRYVFVGTEYLSQAEILQVWSEVTGKPAVYTEVSMDAFNEMWGLVGTELVSQLKMNEAVSSWTDFREEGFVQPDEIGIRDGDIIGLRGSLERLKHMLV